jgi:hypothetical protein
MRGASPGWRTRMWYLVTKGRKIRPLRLAPMDGTYRDAPVDRERHSFSCSEIVTPRSAHSRHLEGSFLVEGELQSPSWFGTCRRTRSRPWVPIRF